MVGMAKKFTSHQKEINLNPPPQRVESDVQAGCFGLSGTQLHENPTHLSQVKSGAHNLRYMHLLKSLACNLRCSRSP